jgi:hypothetical protein
LRYDPNSIEQLFQDDVSQKLIADTDHTVIMIADMSALARTIRGRIEEFWTSQLLGGREKERLFRPKIFHMGDLEGYENQKTDTVSARKELLKSDYESMVRLILKEANQNVVVLFERDTSEAAQTDPERSSKSAAISSRNSYGDRLIAHLKEPVPLTESGVDSLCQLSAMNVVLSRSYDPSETDFAETVFEVAKVPQDYIYLVGFNRAALELLKQLRRAHVQTPVITSPYLEEQLRRITGGPVPGAVDDETPERLGMTYVATTFDAWSDEPDVKSFLEKYGAYLERLRGVPIGDIHKEFPGIAAYGYVSVRLLNAAFERAKTASPQMAAKYARFFVVVKGPLGVNGFNGGRDLLNLPIGFKRLGFGDRIHFIRGSRTRRQP